MIQVQDNFLPKDDFKLLKNTTHELISLGGGNISEWVSNGVFTIDGLYEIESKPVKISLDSAYPNPFNPTTTISFALPMDRDISIQVYNLQGRVVETLANPVKRPVHIPTNKFYKFW